MNTFLLAVLLSTQTVKEMPLQTAGQTHAPHIDIKGANGYATLHKTVKRHKK